MKVSCRHRFNRRRLLPLAKQPFADRYCLKHDRQRPHRNSCSVVLSTAIRCPWAKIPVKVEAERHDVHASNGLCRGSAEIWRVAFSTAASLSCDL
jgi:hypothetical protein